MIETQHLTPEQELLLAVLTQAVTDLGDKDDVIRRDARLFFFAKSGGWERSRTNISEALGVDPDVLQEQLRRAGKVVTERPTAPRHINPFTPDDLLELIPEKEFMLRDLDLPDTVPAHLAYDRVLTLAKRGVVEKISSQTYALTRLQIEKQPSWQSRILATLTDKPQSTQDIARAFKQCPSRDLVHGICSQLVASGKATKSAPGQFALPKTALLAA